jgi:hypothetical protein
LTRCQSVMAACDQLVGAASILSVAVVFCVPLAACVPS